MNDENKDTEFTISSGNVFADLGIPNAEEHLKKAELISEITRFMKSNNLKKKRVAMFFNMTVFELNEILRGRFREFSIDDFREYVSKFKREFEDEQ